MIWRPTELPTSPLIAPFLATVNAHAAFFHTDAPLVVARAPGRLDVMGGIADYSGSLVLELPLAVAACVAAQHSAAPTLTIRSLQAAAIDAAPEVAIALGELAPAGLALDYDAARAFFAADPRAHWAAYVAGALIVLGHERGIVLDRGLRLLVDSEVLPGKGISSSAAIEVAAMQAICALYGVELAGRDLAILCQKVENLVVGAPCGVMDQMTAACGAQDALLALRCQPAELEPAVALPPDLTVWGIDSGIRHAVSGADYSSVRVGAFMGRRMLLERGLFSHEEHEAYDRTYLANITPSRWEQSLRAHVPESISGDAFLAHYGSIGDSVTQVDPTRSYAVRQPTAHPVYENHRVNLFRALLEVDERRKTEDESSNSIVRLSSSVQQRFVLLGELMYQSHASYSACGLGSDGTDLLVELVRVAGPASGLYGAKITGGGSGGTVAVLAQRGAEAAIRGIAAQYERETGRATTLLHGSSPGAKAFGVRWLRAAPR